MNRLVWIDVNYCGAGRYWTCLVYLNGVCATVARGRDKRHAVAAARAELRISRAARRAA